MTRHEREGSVPLLELLVPAAPSLAAAGFFTVFGAALAFSAAGLAVAFGLVVLEAGLAFSVFAAVFFTALVAAALAAG